MNKYKKLISIILIVMCLTGCSMNDYYDKATGELWNRAEMNIAQVQRLFKAGLIDQNTYEAFANGIHENLKSVGITEEQTKEDTENNSGGDIESLIASRDFRSAIRYSQGSPDDGDKLPNVEEVISDLDRDDNGELKLRPFDMLSSSKTQLQELEKKLKYNVYVLKRFDENNNDINQDYPNSYQSLLDIMSSVNVAKQGKNTKDVLGALFIDSGRTVLDVASKDNRIIRDSSHTSGSTLNDKGDDIISDDKYKVSFGRYVDSNNKLVDAYGVEELWNIWGNGNYREEQPTGNYNKLGSDLVLSKVEVKEDEESDGSIKRTYTVARTIAIRMRDFNVDTIDKIVGKQGASGQIYMIDGNNAYLMEYPVFFIKGWKSEKGADGKYKFKAVYQKSDLMVNLISGKVYYKDGSELYNTKGELRLHVNEAVTSGGAVSSSSFVLDGVSRFREKQINNNTATKVTYENKDGVTHSKVSGNDTGFYDNYICDYGAITWSDNVKNHLDKSIQAYAKNGEDTYKANLPYFGSIVLRDYLEYTYAPGVVAGESAVAIGRMFRINAFAGDRSTEIGKFIGKDGSENADYNSISIKSTDLMDLEKLSNSVKAKLSLGEEGSTETTTTTVASGDPNNLQSFLNSNAKTEFVESINSSSRFPGTVINKEDNNNLKNQQDNTKTKPIMYGMALDLDAYSSNLISNWITSSEDKGNLGNLNWWNVWLAESGFTYTIDRDILINSLQGNYNFDITGTNKIILNLNTIKSIQEIYDDQSDNETVGLIKTIFKVLGIILILYGALLICGWIYDTNIVVGPRLLSVLTLGRWVAIASKEEMAELNMENKKFVTLGNVIVSCIGIIALGVILNVIGIIDVILLLIDTLSGLWNILKDAFFG